LTTKYVLVYLSIDD